MTLGKIERFWKTIWEEFLERAQFDSFESAGERMRLWVKHYNHRRPHQSLEGLCPADRFFAIAQELRQVIERGIQENVLELALRGATAQSVLHGGADGRAIGGDPGGEGPGEDARRWRGAAHAAGGQLRPGRRSPCPPKSRAKKEPLPYKAQQRVQAVLAVWTERRRPAEVCRELAITREGAFPLGDSGRLRHAQGAGVAGRGWNRDPR